MPLVAAGSEAAAAVPYPTGLHCPRLALGGLLRLIFVSADLEYSVILPRFPLLFFVQIKAQVCVADIVLHGLSPPFQAHISQRFVTFGSGADVINDGDS